MIGRLQRDGQRQDDGCPLGVDVCRNTDTDLVYEVEPTLVCLAPFFGFQYDVIVQVHSLHLRVRCRSGSIRVVTGGAAFEVVFKPIDSHRLVDPYTSGTTFQSTPSVANRFVTSYYSVSSPCTTTAVGGNLNWCSQTV